jgi:hypothetical protein
MTDRAEALVGGAARAIADVYVADAAADAVATAQAWRDTAIQVAIRDAYAESRHNDVRAIAAAYDRLLLRVPARSGGDVDLAPIGNGERRHRGAYTTPPAIAASLARRAIPHPERAPLVVDPACGSGALLRAALARLLAGGVPAAVAASCVHGVDTDAVAAYVCRTALAVDLIEAGHPVEPDELRGQVRLGDALLDMPGDGGLDWPAAFPRALARDGLTPDPVTGWRGGFDAVVANPPWERLKVHARDWEGRPPSRLRGIRAAAARQVRDGGRHPLTGTGEINAYLPFVETCWRLLAPAGRAAVLVPAGIASDRSGARLLEELVRRGALDRLLLIEPREPVFADVSARVGVAVVELRHGPAASPGHVAAEPAPAEVVVGVEDVDEAPDGLAWPLDAALLRTVNPNTGTAPLFRSARDAAIVTGVHRRLPVLVRRSGPPPEPVVADPWELRLVTPLHMTRDARWFRAGPGDGLLPLWEAKHAGLLDPRGGSRAEPRYWVPAGVVHDRYPDLYARGWLAGYRNVTTAAAPRTLVPTPLPVVAVGNSLPLLSAPRLPLLLAALAALPVDYVVRQKHAGANLNFFKLEQVPLPPPAVYDAPAPWDAGTTAASWVLDRFARAVAWGPGLAALAGELRALGVTVPGAALPAAGRLAALAELDAAHAVLLGLDRAELEHALGTFTALRQREERDCGHFATAARVLAAHEVLNPGS